MELARAWFREGRVAVPCEFSELLSSDPRLQGLVFEQGVPERVTRLPERGEGRNHDLWLLGRTSHEQLTVCVEAKADEPFGDKSVGDYLEFALQQRKKGLTTRAPERIEALFNMVGGSSLSLFESPWASTPYQLLTSICGTSIQASMDKSGFAVFAVHVFQTADTERSKLDTNRSAFSRFVETLAGIPRAAVQSNRLYGPVTIAGVECLIGKTEVIQI
jgi:hypothetical protein